MASFQDIRRRIRSVKNTQQVTKAMKMISAVKLRKSQERLIALRPFAQKMREVSGAIVNRLKGAENLSGLQHPLLQAFLFPREEKSIHILLVASDKGLCGGYNANLLKKAHQFLDTLGTKTTSFDVVGKRSADWARKRKLHVRESYVQIPLQGLERVAQDVSRYAAQAYQGGQIDGLYMIYNHFYSAVNQEPRVVKLFPMEMETSTPKSVDPLLEPNPVVALETLLPKFVETEILSKLIESSASEHGARMAAMDKSTNNAGEVINKLTLTMNKIRQASITNQIIEIVSGANA
jgi:F-type H+-transporting ATPase subunit gamma